MRFQPTGSKISMSQRPSDADSAMPIINHIGHLTIDHFLQNYWQKAPVILRKALPDLTELITPEELAGLACEEFIESRLVTVQQDAPGWQVQHGPFVEQDFTSLPESHYTLLVQDVEKHLPGLHRLIDPFRFIPDWRIDDLMISYAASHGNVGPHTDAYDVFLIQTMGQRRWQIAEDYDTALLADCDLQILANFEAEQEWIVEPGDVLYLPPGVAHYGVALGPCMTCSVGFRAPADYELLSGYTDWLLDQQDCTSRYTDAGRAAVIHSSRIPDQDLSDLRKRLQAALRSDDRSIDIWLGCGLTTPKEILAIQSPGECNNLDSFITTWQQHEQLVRNPACRFLYANISDGWHLFVHGEHIEISDDLACLLPEICEQHDMTYDENIIPASLALMYEFYVRGYYYFDA